LVGDKEFYLKIYTQKILFLLDIDRVGTEVKIRALIEEIRKIFIKFFK
jgi:hypothetical protein